MLRHGGDLATVVKLYHIPKGLWLDLSTGIAPVGYPVPALPAEVWRRLPVRNGSFFEAAQSYYQADALRAVGGSQQAIQALPQYRRQLKKESGVVWVPLQGYKEHQNAWLTAGFTIKHYVKLPHTSELSAQDVVVIINPNNPTGAVQPLDSISKLHERLVELDGWLIVDEAFGDAVSGFDSTVPLTCDKHCFVLRSMGKFFGLAGLRIGFVIAHEQHLALLDNFIGPWPVNGPALFIAEEALKDTRWQQKQQTALKQTSVYLHDLLKENLAVETVGTNLFRTAYLQDAKALHHHLCSYGIYTRLTDEKDAIRFGLPNCNDMARLKSVLDNYKHASVGSVC